MTDGTVHSQTFRSLLKSNFRNYSMILMLFIIMAVFAFTTGGVNLNSRNISNIITQNSFVMLLSVGMLLVIVTGNIDLSAGSFCALTGAVSAMLYNAGLGVGLTMFVVILFGVAIGAFQGSWIAYLKVPAFIVTLAGALMFRGITYIITNVTPISLRDDNFKQISTGMANIPGLEFGKVYGTALLVGAVLFLIYVAFEVAGRQRKIRNKFEVLSVGLFIGKLLVMGVLIGLMAWKLSTYRGMPTVMIVLGVTIMAFVFITNNTIMGRYIYAVGGNARSAKLSGINSEMVVFVVYCIMGGLCGLAGMVYTGYMNSALPQAGVNLELDAISACFIGGASASGGIGTVIGAITGGLVMAAINNGMSLMNIAAQWQYVVKAAVLLLAVLYDIYTRRKSGLG